PGKAVAVLLLDWPQQALCLVEVGVVGPAVQWRETLHATIGAATTIEGAVGAGVVPRHTDEEGTVVTIVSGPPILGGFHQHLQIFDDGVEIEAGERFSIVKVSPQRVVGGRVHAQRREIEAVWPPVIVVWSNLGGRQTERGQAHGHESGSGDCLSYH